MKKILKTKFFRIFLLLLGLICLSMNFAMADDTGEIKILVTNFFDSLKTGDTDGIILSLTDPILNERRELLVTNPGYPDQLRRIYERVKIEFESVTIKKYDTARIDVQIEMNSGSLRKTSFICKKINGTWKISQEVEDY